MTKNPKSPRKPADQNLLELQKIQGQMVMILERLNKVESMFTETAEAKAMLSAIRLLKAGAELTGQPISGLIALSESRELLLRPGIQKDEIAKAIIRILITTGPLNVSQISRRLREERGSASRRIVRERLQRLSELEIVEKSTTHPNAYQIKNHPPKESPK